MPGDRLMLVLELWVFLFKQLLKFLLSSTIDLQPSPVPELHEPIVVDLQQFRKIQPTTETLVQILSILELQ